jgi:hypothetical protein
VPFGAAIRHSAVGTNPTASMPTPSARQDQLMRAVTTKWR